MKKYEKNGLYPFGSGKKNEKNGLSLFGSENIPWKKMDYTYLGLKNEPSLFGSEKRMVIFDGDLLVYPGRAIWLKVRGLFCARSR